RARRPRAGDPGRRLLGRGPERARRCRRRGGRLSRRAADAAAPALTSTSEKAGSPQKLDEVEQLVQVLDRRPVPGLALGSERLSRCSELERVHPGTFRARKLVVRPVADEDTVARFDAEALAGELVDPRVG